ncbi:hypothetical protein TrVE_jg13515 [Triparma verrucosa]|uniref:Importin N-terminal domain-containing protein n=1 Tax=Triparma verrucosa TaxID=1606542 RepID=A0A9W7CHN7_9STRA|nr:hypothetical protein TrVE_jg13515 [Triparma verrucosa]
MDPAQLRQVEELANTLYTSSSTSARNDAQSRLLSLQTSPQNIPTCQQILDSSQQPYALLVASNSLMSLITGHWNSFTTSQRLEIRNYVLSYLGNNPHHPNYVTSQLVRLVCRITKLGWFDDRSHRELPEEVTKFLQATVEHCVLGLKLLNGLVEELNVPTTGRTLTQHRKTAVSFRDVSLFRVFQLALTTLSQLKTSTIQTSQQNLSTLTEQSLTLTVRCLSFDFIGTNPDESSEDVGTIQVPSTWRSVIQDSETLNLLLHFYSTQEPPKSDKAMEAIILLTSCRRSLFPTDKDRAAFLGRLLNGITILLRNQTGLEHSENYHQFCRLLGRLKANYQLSELVKATGYTEWLSLASSFTVQSMQNWQLSRNSIHYLLALFGRLVAAVPYVRPDAGAKGHTKSLEDAVGSVVQNYVDCMLGSVQTVLQEECDDPLDDSGSLTEQLERLPVICRFQYAKVGTLLVERFDPIMASYQNAIATLNNNNIPVQTQQKLTMLEGQLTWLVYIIGAVVGGHSWSTSHLDDGEERIDATLSRRVFQLVQLIDFRCCQSNGTALCDSKLESAFLFYFQNFRRVYMFMWDQPTGSSSGIVTAGKVDAQPTTKQRVYKNMFDFMAMGDHTQVANLIVTKVGNNLKYWPSNEEVISKTLELFHDMASGYSSSKLLLTLDTVKYLLMNHTAAAFPFLEVKGNERHRTTFHATLTRLLFSSTAEEMPLPFDNFIDPICEVLRQLGSLDAQGLKSPQVRTPLIGVLRDLRGIASSLHNRRTYLMLFERLFPEHFPLLTRISEVWYDDPGVTTSLLKFMYEFVYNKANRVNFEQSSPNGILLFRTTSDVICAYGKNSIAFHSQNTVPETEVYKQKYKGFALSLDVLVAALSGNYVCFGVFQLYNDPALDRALEVALQMILSISLDDVMAYPKLSKSYFSFLEILFRSHIQVVLALTTPTLMSLLNAVHEGLQSSDAPLSSICATSVDHLSTYYYTNQNKENKPEVAQLKQHLAAEPNLFAGLTATLFNLLLFGSASNHWAVMRPMLSLMLASERSFTQYKDQLMSTQSPANQSALNEAFDKLLADVSRNLESQNRDRFTQRLTAFRVTTRSFLTL